jgi:hypothetical protein
MRDARVRARVDESFDRRHYARNDDIVAGRVQVVERVIGNLECGRHLGDVEFYEVGSARDRTARNVKIVGNYDFDIAFAQAVDDFVESGLCVGWRDVLATVVDADLDDGNLRVGGNRGIEPCQRAGSHVAIPASVDDLHIVTPRFERSFKLGRIVLAARDIPAERIACAEGHDLDRWFCRARAEKQQQCA